MYIAGYWKAPQSQDHLQHGGSSSRTQRAPMLKRWLNDGIVKDTDRTGHRNDYPRGAEGMGQYLEDWNTTWAGLAKNAKNGKQS